MALYNIEVETTPTGLLLRLGFGAPAQNNDIVREVKARMEELIGSGELAGGGALRINGPASLPVAGVIVHAVAHLFSTIGVFDPKLNKYVVCIAHGNDFAVGDLID